MSEVKPNPLLQRTNKLKSTRKPKPKKKAASSSHAPPLVASPADPSSVSSAIEYLEDSHEAGMEDGEVLDLADQLLEQLDSTRLEDQDQDGDDHVEPLLPKAGTVDTSGTASGSSPSLRDKMHEIKEGVKDKLNGDSSPPPEKKVSRQQARKLRKANHFDFLRSTAQAEVDAENDHSVEDEKKAIDAGCVKLGVRIKEIEPDGHCLYSAIADQANVLGLTLTQRKETSSSTRYYAANYMRTHPDDFLPFLTSEVNDDDLMSESEYASYCDTVENTGEWGGQHEINALSKYFKAPIWVLQAGTDLVKVGQDDFGKEARGPMLISYHRKMYGLGEHYNSLRKVA